MTDNERKTILLLFETKLKKKKTKKKHFFEFSFNSVVSLLNALGEKKLLLNLLSCRVIVKKRHQAYDHHLYKVKKEKRNKNKNEEELKNGKNWWVETKRIEKLNPLHKWNVSFRNDKCNLKLDKNQYFFFISDNWIRHQGKKYRKFICAKWEQRRRRRRNKKNR